MPLRDFFTRAGIKRLLSRIRPGGFTVNDILRDNNRKNKEAFREVFRQAVRNDMPLDVAIREFGRVSSSRKAHSLRTFKNIMLAVRGQARAVIAGRRNGFWLSRGILDSATTNICVRLRGARYHLPYTQVPNKPPRTPPIHPCRSFLQFVPEGEQPPTEESFETLWRDNPELQRELLGPTRFESFQNGELGRIETFAQFERVVLTPVSEL